MVQSIVDFLPETVPHSCGYCKSPSSNYNDGMWAYSLTVQDYQDLIDRGWRRSGRFCYKPIMNKTCCPLYTIKCEALSFKLSKSQKKLLKRVNRYLREGGRDREETGSQEDSFGSEQREVEFCGNIHLERGDIAVLGAEGVSKDIGLTEEELVAQDDYRVEDGDHSFSCDTELPQKEVKASPEGSGSANQGSAGSKSKPRDGDGKDPSKPQCKKAKLIRLERKMKKLEEQGLSASPLPKKLSNVEKTLEDFIQEGVQGSTAHRLEIKLVRSSPASVDFKATLKQEWELYRKYQVSVHKDPPSKCSMEQFQRFLVLSPLTPLKIDNGPSMGYGSFHQQYWLDDQLVAVGVIDILPKCVSSVYFFYDPEYSHLTLGTYAALREVAFVRSLERRARSLKYYYMGFYVHSCPKMKYKALVKPSFFLCPEVYTWHPVEECLPLLDLSKYSRLNSNPDATCPETDFNINEALVLWHNTVMPYSIYVEKKMSHKDKEEVQYYGKLVGQSCACRMFLYRS